MLLFSIDLTQNSSLGIQQAKMTWQQNIKIYRQSECVEKYRVQNVIENRILTSYSDKSYFVVS